MQHGNERRQLILAAAERLLRHYGSHKTTVQDIAREAGVGVGTVYLEFACKDEILASLTSSLYEAVLRAMQRSARADGSFSTRLRLLLEQRVCRLAELADDGQHGVDLLTCACPRVRSVAMRFREDEEALLTDLLREGDRAGELDVPHPRDTARLLLRIYDCFAPPAEHRPHAETLTEQLDSVHRLVLRGLVTRDPSRT